MPVSHVKILCAVPVLRSAKQAVPMVPPAPVKPADFKSCNCSSLILASASKFDLHSFDRSIYTTSSISILTNEDKVFFNQFLPVNAGNVFQLLEVVEPLTTQGHAELNESSWQWNNPHQADAFGFAQQ